jgi:hypothetical protein
VKSDLVSTNRTLFCLRDNILNKQQPISSVGMFVEEKNFQTLDEKKKCSGSVPGIYQTYYEDPIKNQFQIRGKS